MGKIWEIGKVRGSAQPLAAEAASLIGKETSALWSLIREVQSSAQPLATEAASLIGKETSALRSLIQEVQEFRDLKN
jgi:hypothetical protein